MTETKMSEDMCPICDGKMLYQDGKKFCPDCDVVWCGRGARSRRGLKREESEDMTDVRERLTKTIEVIDKYSGEGTTATGDLLRAARDSIDAQDAKIKELKELMKEMIAAIDKCFTPDDLACERLANRARRLLDD
jgi:uncharacterized Zn finger protein (UPF0148 family)